MTYIELINAVWELREQGIITVCEHDLYNYLLHRCNRLNWKNPFHQSTSIMCAVLGINRSTLSARRKRLKQLGLINYKEGKARTRPAEYRILTPNNNIHSQVVKAQKQEKKEDGKLTGKEIFRKPVLSDVEAYCKERGNIVDAQVFFDFYQSKNWMIGRNKMKDWRASLRTWEKKRKDVKHPSALHNNEKQYEKF